MTEVVCVCEPTVIKDRMDTTVAKSDCSCDRLVLLCDITANMLASFLLLSALTGLSFNDFAELEKTHNV